MVNSIYDSEGSLQTTPLNILPTLTMFTKNKYDTIQVNLDSVYRRLWRTNKQVPQEANFAFDAPTTRD